MDIVHSSQIPSRIPDWAEQLATLTRVAWTGDDGKCYFPYIPLTQADLWRTKVYADWIEGRMHSWVLVVDDRIVSHAALVDKGVYWELGRLVARNAPRGGTNAVCVERLRFCREQKIHGRMECTQAHTRAQRHAARVGMRFAGLGFLDKIDGVNWDIVFFDTLESAPFVPRRGVLGDPLGVELVCTDADRVRLCQIKSILTTESGGALPPARFHVLPELLESVRLIIDLNV
jgi:hypothetical protein